MGITRLPTPFGPSPLKGIRRRDFVAVMTFFVASSGSALRGLRTPESRLQIGLSPQVLSQGLRETPIHPKKALENHRSRSKGLHSSIAEAP